MSKSINDKNNCLYDICKSSKKNKGWPWSNTPGEISDAMPKGLSWPKITVVTPSYNQGEFIEETIRSVMLQNYPNLEYFIVDGGSNDKSLDVIKKYEKWITWWISEKDHGQSHAINKGFNRATGDIFGWLCSDDVYAPRALYRAAKKLYGLRKAMLVGASIITYGPNTLNGRRDERFPNFIDMAYDVKTLPQPSVFWTRDLWKIAGPLKEELYYVMDYDLWLRMFPKANDVIHIEEVLSCQRTQPCQKTARSRSGVHNMRKDRVKVAYEAALGRGETGFGWLLRVFWIRLKKYRYRFWELKEPGFHWQVARYVIHKQLLRLEKNFIQNVRTIW